VTRDGELYLCGYCAKQYAFSASLGKDSGRTPSDGPFGIIKSIQPNGRLLRPGQPPGTRSSAWLSRPCLPGETAQRHRLSAEHARPAAPSRWRTEATGRRLADPITHRCARRPSGRSAQSAAVLHHLVRPRASLRARLAEPHLWHVPCRRPRPVTHMMPCIWVVPVPVAPFPAAICPGELRTAEHADLLSDLCIGAGTVLAAFGRWLP
jgi:hypothetical protein